MYIYICERSHAFRCIPGGRSGATPSELRLPDGLQRALASQHNAVQLEAVRACAAPGGGFRLLQVTTRKESVPPSSVVKCLWEVFI